MNEKWKHREHVCLSAEHTPKERCTFDFILCFVNIFILVCLRCLCYPVFPIACAKKYESIPIGIGFDDIGCVGNAA